MLPFRRRGILLLVSFAMSGCTSPTSAIHNAPVTTGNREIYAITNVNVIPMTAGGAVLPHATVVIESGKIVSLQGPVPKSARIINGGGKWLMPGLIDMHVHIPTDGNFNSAYPTRTASIFTNTQDVMTPFVANGVTTIFALNAFVGSFGQRNEVLRGDVIGPRIALAAMVNGGNYAGAANTPADGRQSVRIAKFEGFEFIKVYSGLDAETFKAVVDEARIQGMKVVGHIPDAFRGKAEEAHVPGFAMVAHAEEYAKLTTDFSEADARRFAQLAEDNGTWLAPTLIVMARIAEQTRSLDNVRNLPELKYVHPLIQSKWLTANKHYTGTNPGRVARVDRTVQFNNLLVRTFKEAGVPIVAGTDAGSSGVISGFSLHDELELLVEAGLTPKEALISATRLPAEWLGIEDKIGTVAVGKFADLILLDDNPMENIRNTRAISGVFVNGRWLNRNFIDNMLVYLAMRNAGLSGRFDWSKRAEY